ncbi:Titin [Araneus ventricosus]|uniref:Titin n=1 Tax=Araneus ventricosus TaxID=182803 RepID=A0A4Y2EVZ4_ARAVE|nr:Titin [Araneus ventricosus]
MPRISPFHFPGELDVGMRASVQCTVMTGDPPFEFTWYKDEQKLSDTHSISIRKFDDFTFTLVISKVEANSNGNYTCKVANAKGFDEKSAVLSVKDSGEPKIKSFQFSNDVEIGMREVIHCVVMHGDPPFEFFWFKDGQPLGNSRGNSYRKTDDYDSKLVISKVDADSNGNYTCRVTNSVGSDQKSAVLSVKDSGAPRIKALHFTRDLELGMRESVNCAIVYGDPPFEFSWFKDGKPIVDMHGVSARKIDEFTSMLVISKVNAESNGNYTCKVSNANGFDEKSAILSVKGSGEPKIKSFHFSNELELGMREIVHCNVIHGDAPFEFSWFKDGQLLKDGQSISIRKTDDYVSKLVIIKVDADSNGNYTCRVSNSNGFDEKSAVLSVKGAFVGSFNIRI